MIGNDKQSPYRELDGVCEAVVPRHPLRSRGLSDRRGRWRRCTPRRRRLREYRRAGHERKPARGRRSTGWRTSGDGYRRDWCAGRWCNCGALRRRLGASSNTGNRRRRKLHLVGLRGRSVLRRGLPAGRVLGSHPDSRDGGRPNHGNDRSPPTVRGDRRRRPKQKRRRGLRR